MPSLTVINEPTTLAGWTYAVLDEVTSTNTVAAQLPAWHAVRAVTQTAGRGRTGRHWVSDSGGLWLSAVVPCPGERSRWATLPLVVGYALQSALSELGVKPLRLRWPNDLMTGPRKLAGLLVERYTADTAVVGIGVNVFNSPEAEAPELSAQTARLADLIPAHHDLDAIAATILRALTVAHDLLARETFAPIAAHLNHAWARPRPVAVTPNGTTAPFTGLFEGVDAVGSLRVRTGDGRLHVYAAAEIALLRELN